MITPADIQAASIQINGVDIYTAVGAIVEKYTIGGSPVNSEIYQGLNSTSFNLLLQSFGMREITVSIFLSASTRREITLKKSRLDAMMWGKVELLMPDGFYYTSVLTSAGALSLLGVEGNEEIAICEYTFEGIQHDALVTSTGNAPVCTSTMPYTNCRLTCTASQDRTSLQIATVTITDVHQGDVLVVDGILGRILQNGAPCAGNMSFIKFPQLVPGSNSLTCPETLTVEYYPTYI